MHHHRRVGVLPLLDAYASLSTLVRVAGIRWCVEESFQAAKDHAGLDHYQVRGWRSCHRYITLSMLALAILAMLTAATAPPADPDPHHYVQQPGRSP